MIHALVSGKVVGVGTDVPEAPSSNPVLLVMEVRAAFKDKPAMFIGVWVSRENSEKYREPIEKGYTLHFQVDEFVYPRRPYWEFDNRPAAFMKSSFRLF